MTAPIRITIEADAELAEALGRGIGLALAPYVEELREAVQRLRTDVQAAAGSAYGRATGAREEDANETGACPPAAPQSAGEDGSPGPDCQVPAPLASAPPPVEALSPSPAVAAARPARPPRRKPEITEEGLARIRENAAKARAAMAAKRAAAKAAEAPPDGATVATYDQIATWSAPRGIPFAGWEDLPRVNAKRTELGLPPFARKPAGVGR